MGTTRHRRRTGAPAIPQAPDELTAEWFTGALAPHAGGARVRTVNNDTIGTDVGFAGEVYRCHLDWSDHNPEGDRATEPPASVIVKVPSQRPENRATVEAVNAYEREILVYRELGTGLGLPMPAHLHSDFTSNPAPWLEPVLRFLFDHLPIRALVWLVGRAFARFHAANWMRRDRIEAHPFVNPANRGRSSTATSGSTTCCSGPTATWW